MRVLTIGTPTGKHARTECVMCRVGMLEADATLCDTCAHKFARTLEAILEKFGTALVKRVEDR